MEYAVDGSIKAITITESTISASVSGTRPRPYLVQILLKGKRAQTDCNCPVGGDCKHIAAVLIKVIKTLDQEAKLQSLKDVEIKPVAETNLSGTSDQTIPKGPPLPGDLLSWLSTFETLTNLGADEYPSNVQNRVLYILEGLGSISECPRVSAVTVAPTKVGGFGVVDRGSFKHLSTDSRPPHVLRIDVPILNALGHLQPPYSYKHFCELRRGEGSTLFDQMLATGRLHFKDPNSVSLKSGPARSVGFRWKENKAGTQMLEVEIANQGTILFLDNLRYLDPVTGEVGPLDYGSLTQEIVRHCLKAPKLKGLYASQVAKSLTELFPQVSTIVPRAIQPPRTESVPPIPILTIVEETLAFRGFSWGTATKLIHTPIASLEFKYGEGKVRWENKAVSIGVGTGESMVQYVRDFEIEQEYRQTLAKLMWHALGSEMSPINKPKSNAYLVFQPLISSLKHPLVDCWTKFSRETVAKLRDAGWIVNLDSRLAPAPLANFDSLSIQVDRAADADWFNLSLDIDVNGNTVQLLPIIIQTLHTYGLSNLQNIPDSENILLKISSGQQIAVPAHRLKPILETLIHLFNPENPGSEKEQLSINQLALLADLEERLQGGIAQWRDPNSLLEIGRKLRNFKRIDSVEPSQNLLATLRPYQQEGLSWMQFLHEYGFHGVLADDMGLGKTVQTIAHLLNLKDADRLKQPALIIAPTSTLPNWEAEFEKFAPSLKVQLIHGSDRHGRYEKIEQFDVILSSYPLLARDAKVLQAHSFSAVIFDEAQTIKNSKSQWSQSAALLKGEQRIALSGTPIENNLAELWSLFRVISPGLLGTLKQFNAEFRGPIEKLKDEEARKNLQRRIRPFLLRRTKEEVAKDLPPKTVMSEYVTLTDEQRDLYETVRNAVNKRVRDELAEKGMARSQIVILDALLKLRQVCCDPTLVKLEAAKAIQTSAKRERLKELIQELLEDGRKILVFSQFTSMLDLIEKDLENAGLSFVKLTGETKDRKTPVEQFQRGDVSIFLISLKAGGTGLNLTAADTVIHYDPWWNPAVERQATDRAHRIGQDKPVFVYKLIASGTVEEKIQEMQTSKAALADSLFEDRLDSSTSLTPQDLEWILSPLKSFSSEA